jgi:hypothetical protein
MDLVLDALKAIGASVWVMPREGALRPLIFLISESFVYLYCAFRDSMSSDEVSCLLFQTTAPTASQVHKICSYCRVLDVLREDQSIHSPPKTFLASIMRWAESGLSLGIPA